MDLSQPQLACDQSYDRVAAEYCAQYADELLHKPLDRSLLDRFAFLTQGQGEVCDLGCGPGQVASYLHNMGLRVRGIDASAQMVASAQARLPYIPFSQADMRALPFADSSWAGAVAFYSIIHMPRRQVVCALREIRRVLIPEGVLLLSFHVGGDTIIVDRMWGKDVGLAFVLFTPAEMHSYLEQAGFVVDDIVEREPYPQVEYQVRRTYIFAHRRGTVGAQAGQGDVYPA